MQDLSRRQFLKLGVCAAVSMALPRTAWAGDSAKKLSFYNLHTGEKLQLAYSEKGKYVPQALHELNKFLRDWRTNDISEIDPALFDQLYRLQQLAEASGPYNVICGYRSPRTNNMLHEHSGGVAKHSLHMEGKAIDISLPGKDLKLLHKAALSMNAGGVGYYPTSDFIHIDTGHVRHWG